jgi:hypothetical protein
MHLSTWHLHQCKFIQTHPCMLCIAPTAADVEMPDIDEMETLTVLWSLARSKSYLASGCLITCMPAIVRIAVVIDAVSRNHMHVDYSLEGEVLRRLRNVKHCTLEEFLATILDHVDKRRKLIEEAIKQPK